MIVKQVIAILILFTILHTCLCQQLKRQERSNTNIKQYEQQEIASQKEKPRADKKKQVGVIKQYKGTVDYYTFIYSYELFQDYFIASTDDENIKNIKQIVQKYFSSFIYYENIIAAFRRYMGDYIEYMVLFKSSIGKKFKVFVRFIPDDLTLELDRIEILKLSNERTNRRNCAVSQNFFCVECDKNYSLYKGRCHLQQEQCIKYDPEECFECIQGFSLQSGICVQNQ